MKTKRIAELSEELPKKSKLAIFEVIDLKVESDMEKILAEIRGYRSETQSEIRTLKWLMGIEFTLISAIIVLSNFLK